MDSIIETSLLENGFTHLDFINHYEMCLEEEDNEVSAYHRHKDEMLKTFYALNPDLKPKKKTRVYKGQFENQRKKSDIIKKYFITLTSGKDDPHEYMNAIKRILKQKVFKIISGYGCIELTKKGNPHAHIYIESYTYLDLQKLKRCWEFTSIDKKSVKKDNGIKNYINKDEKNAKLLSYLSSHNCERTFKI